MPFRERILNRNREPRPGTAKEAGYIALAGEVAGREPMTWDRLGHNAAAAGLKDQLDAVRSGTNKDPLDVATAQALGSLMDKFKGRTLQHQVARFGVKDGWPQQITIGQGAQSTEWPVGGPQGYQLFNRIKSLAGVSGPGELVSETTSVENRTTSITRYDTGTDMDLVVENSSPRNRLDDGWASIHVVPKGQEFGAPVQFGAMGGNERPADLTVNGSFPAPGQY